VTRPALGLLARAYGIVPEYDDIRGIRRVTSDATRAALLAAMGIDASSDQLAEHALSRIERERRDAIAEPVTVLRHDLSGLRLDLPQDRHGRIEWRVDLITEDGDRRSTEGTATSRRGQRTMRVPLPDGLRYGYHSARVSLRIDHALHECETFLIAAPETCTPLHDVIGDDRVFGLTVNLYAVRSARNRGVGDLTDLAALCEWTARQGGEFVGINPLHALRNTGSYISPYSPVSRLFRNPLYIDVSAVPELEGSAEARAILESADTTARLASLRAAHRLDCDAVTAIQRPVLEALHRAFRAAGAGTPRGRAFAAFAWRHGAALRDFATFHALAGALGSADWRDWPAGFRDPGSADVVAFRNANEDAVDFHAYLQFELDRQLGRTAERGRSAGLRIGIYGDLAIGSAISGSDRWSFPDLFIDDAAIGAPPDDYAPHGQNWSLPPLDPNRLAADRYRYWILLVRNALSHCGALRIDHVMGLFRQFWVPAAGDRRDGAYVRYPSAALLAILAIESRRREAIVIGEDLGTVPRGLPSRLARHGILSTRVLYFERDAAGEFRPPSAYSRRALVTVNTHDHAPLAGWWRDRDIEARYGAGDLDETERSRALELRAAERASLRRRLAAANILPQGANPDAPDLCAAVHAFLSCSPAPLLGVALDDLAGETEPVNLPGVTADRFPSWTRRTRLTVEKLADDAAVDHALQGVESRLPGIAG